MQNKRHITKRVLSILCAPLIAVTPGTIITGAVVGGAATLATLEQSEAALGGVRRTSRRTARRTTTRRTVARPAVRGTARRTSRRVARRTTRRLMVLPAAASAVMIGGATYYYANNAYWEPVYSGGNTTYVEVIVEDY